MKNGLRHLSSFAAPVVVCLVIPYLIIRSEQRSPVPQVTASIGLFIPGLLVCVAGLAFFITCVRMFILIGNGTIMPWDPTRKLITASLYGYVRNPMILSVIIIVIGEALLFASYGIALLAIFFFVLNTVYFIFSEEPGLGKRFGAEYNEYKKNVPRWIPRLKPWRPGPSRE
jgi:protein-S-isoprenylcysteine O-methyltransferase Ste14